VKVTEESEIRQIIEEVIEKKFGVSFQDTLSRGEQQMWHLNQNLDGMNVYLNSKRDLAVGDSPTSEDLKSIVAQSQHTKNTQNSFLEAVFKILIALVLVVD